MACRTHSPASLMALPPYGPLLHQFMSDRRTKYLAQHVRCTGCGREGYRAIHSGAIDWSRKPDSGVRAQIASWNAEVSACRRSPPDEADPDNS